MLSRLKKCLEKADMKDLCTLCLLRTRIERPSRTFESPTVGKRTASMSRESLQHCGFIFSVRSTLMVYATRECPNQQQRGPYGRSDLGPWTGLSSCVLVKSPFLREPLLMRDPRCSRSASCNGALRQGGWLLGRRRALGDCRTSRNHARNRDAART